MKCKSYWYFIHTLLIFCQFICWFTRWCKFEQCKYCNSLIISVILDYSLTLFIHKGLQNINVCWKNPKYEIPAFLQLFIIIRSLQRLTNISLWVQCIMNINKAHHFIFSNILFHEKLLHIHSLSLSRIRRYFSWSYSRSFIKN